MTREEAEVYLRGRVRVLEARYVRDYPKWTQADMVAVSLLLTARSTSEPPTEQTNTRSGVVVDTARRTGLVVGWDLAGPDEWSADAEEDADAGQ